MARLLDLFCGAGGAAMGYHRAGFDEIVGVDIKFQKHYPFTFVQGDALEYASAHSHEFDAIHASPPCQAYSVMRRGRWKDREHPELIKPVRDLLIASGKPYVIENVGGSRKELRNPVMLCGTMFGLETETRNQLRRHRYFECSWGIVFTSPCQHNKFSSIGVHGGGQHPGRQSWYRSKPNVVGDFGIKARREVMGIDWMSSSEIVEAIPPAYTEFLGKYLLEEAVKNNSRG